MAFLIHEKNRLELIHFFWEVCCYPQKRIELNSQNGALNLKWSALLVKSWRCGIWSKTSHWGKFFTDKPHKGQKYKIQDFFNQLTYFFIQWKQFWAWRLRYFACIDKAIKRNLLKTVLLVRWFSKRIWASCYTAFHDDSTWFVSHHNQLFCSMHLITIH